MNVEAEDFVSEWSTLWNETDEFPYHRVAELEGRIVGHILLYNRPTGDLRVPKQNIDLAHAATIEEARGSGVEPRADSGRVLDGRARRASARSRPTGVSSTSMASRYWPGRLPPDLLPARPRRPAGTRLDMPTPSTIALFSVAAIALAVVPGPAVAYIVTQSVDKGRRAGLVSALGVASGGIVHVAAATVGLSALVASSATAFTASSWSAPRI